MAFFNAPLKVENHENRACKTALAQQKKLREINKKNTELGLPEIQIRIWINTGEVMHGNLWSSWKKINYTVIWDDVNIASRLEGINKIYGTSIILSENTYKKVKDDFLFRELDTIMVKWKSKSVKIYELIWSLKDTETHSSLIDSYEKALAAYYKADYDSALDIFKTLKDDSASKTMIQRIGEIQNGNIEITNGVHKFKIK